MNKYTLYTYNYENLNEIKEKLLEENSKIIYPQDIDNTNNNSIDMEYYYIDITSFFNLCKHKKEYEYELINVILKIRDLENYFILT